jgi:riboflavin synthase
MSRATLETTNLGRLKAGGKVNLELPLTTESRLGGHYVLGHIDTLGTLSDIKEAGNASAAAITVPGGFEKYLVEKGSVAVDGVSLTVASIEKNNFTAVILPLTFQSTIFQYARAGDRVNLEGDILAKYIFKYLEAYQGIKTGRGGIDESFLKKYGYL